MTVPTLCAAALAPRIAKVYLSRHLLSWRSLTTVANYSYPLAGFVPDVLGKTDLPQIARSIAPRPVIVAGALDAAGHPVAPADAPYQNYREKPAWDFEALSQL